MLVVVISPTVFYTLLCIWLWVITTLIKSKATSIVKTTVVLYTTEEEKMLHSAFLITYNFCFIVTEIASFDLVRHRLYLLYQSWFQLNNLTCKKAVFSTYINITQPCLLCGYFSFSFGFCFGKKKELWSVLLITNVCFTNNNFIPWCSLCLSAYTTAFTLLTKTNIAHHLNSNSDSTKSCDNFERV